MANHMVNTPICCPSRTTLLSGRYYHNNKMDSDQGGCMHMNISEGDGRFEWHTVARYLNKTGYDTGYFGKYLNGMPEICSKKKPAPYWTQYQVMCHVDYYNAKWLNNTDAYKTGSDPEEYTTSLIGNYTLDWLRNRHQAGNDAPFFVTMAPHAPHLPSTPADWYKNVWPQGLRAPQPPNYNYSALDHHWLLAQQPILNGPDVEGIDTEYTNRLRTLLTVDDLITAMAEYLISIGEWDNTYFFYTSDHGYSLGEFRIPSHKSQVYDHNLRVPMPIKGPGIAPGSQCNHPTAMVDLMPTFVDIAGGNPPPFADGKSFLPLINAEHPAHTTTEWRTFTLVEYESIRAKPQMSGQGDGLPTRNNGKNTHFHDCANNTYRAVRQHGRQGQGQFLYAEFTDFRTNWNFDDSGIDFYEYYDVDSDPYQLHNIYNTLNNSYKEQLHNYLVSAWKCQGSDCEAPLTFQS
eukprot:TRINITY_DN2210_c0_g1_i2.p1 TRINITY_DN2210_c0_g1~~TRINITY_DN2210_c0_g1_i2.p1  ORF type:complete len:519 (+),score=99.21 TRINITY_DN2210_c0_g1_i2:179-1558(+)